MSSLADSPFVSVVIQVHRPGPALRPYVQALASTAADRYPNHEILIVDNASRDNTTAVLAELVKTTPNVQVIRLGNHMTTHVALTAGLDICIGDIVVIADLSDPPAAVLDAIALIRDPIEVVYGVDTSPRHGLRTRIAGAVWAGFRSVFRRTSGAELPADAVGLRCITRGVLNPWLSSHDRSRLLLVMPALSGRPSAVLKYQRAPVSTQTPALMEFSRSTVGALLASSAAPLRFAYILAMVGSLLNLVYALYVVLIATVRGHVVAGWTSLSLQSSGMFFLISLILGITAEYVLQIVERTLDRPVYRVDLEETSPNLTTAERLNLVATDDALSPKTAPGTEED